MRSLSGWACLFAASALALGCNSILGFDQDYKTTSGSAAGGAGGGTSTGGSNTGGNSTGGNGTGAGNTGGGDPCVKAEDCPPAANSCSQRVCDASVCGTLPTAKDTPADQQTPGDCGKIVCDGTGSITLVADGSDVPAAQDECHVGSCEGGPPHQVAVAAGNPCSAGGKLCDGGGLCVECLQDSDCPGGACAGNACAAASCGDGVKDGGETDLDCGGTCGASCVVGQMCAGDGDCVSGNCAGGTCALVAVGKACGADTDCASGFCVSGVCCETSCLGACNTCGTGACTPVDAGVDPGGACDPSVCNGQGSCGICEPGTIIGECCVECAKDPGPASAVPGTPDNAPPCCTKLYCGFDGEPGVCL